MIAYDNMHYVSALLTAWIVVFSKNELKVIQQSALAI